MKRIKKVLFSRLGLAGVIVAVELALILTLLLRLSSYSVYFFIFLVALNIISLFAVINDTGNPEYKLTWMGVILLVPFLGVVMWMLFKRHNMTPREVSVIVEVVDELLPSKGEGELDSLKVESPLAHGKALSLLSIDNMAEVYCGTVSTYFETGREMYESMLADIDGAREFIFLEYFIIAPGVMWSGILEKLKEKVKSGVEVRVMYDDVGSMGKLPRGYASELKAQGIEAKCFARVSASKITSNSLASNAFCVVLHSIPRAVINSVICLLLMPRSFAKLATLNAIFPPCLPQSVRNTLPKFTPQERACFLH